MPCVEHPILFPTKPSLQLFLVKSYNGQNKRFTQTRVTKCRLWLDVKAYFEVKSSFQIFSSKRVSSWSTGLVCRQSTIRESPDLNNKGNPPGRPWQIRDRKIWLVNKREKSYCGFPSWSWNIDLLPGLLLALVKYAQLCHFLDLGNLFWYFMLNG